MLFFEHCIPHEAVVSAALCQQPGFETVPIQAGPGRVRKASEIERSYSLTCSYVTRRPLEAVY